MVQVIVGKGKGSNDHFAASLCDTTLEINDEGLRVCAVCDRIRLSHVQPCIHCTYADRMRVIWLGLFLMALVALSVSLAFAVDFRSVPESRPVEVLDVQAGPH